MPAPLEVRPPINRRRFRNLVGQKYGCWEVIEHLGFKGRFSYWRVRCECGRELEKFSTAFYVAPEKCRCRSAKYIDGVPRMKHPLRSLWDNIVQNHGESLHQPWRESMGQFVSDIGPRPTNKHRLLRWPDVKGRWEPGNVRWCLRAEGIPHGHGGIEFNGECLTLEGWGKRLGLTRERIRQLLKRFPKEIALGADGDARWQLYRDRRSAQTAERHAELERQIRENIDACKNMAELASRVGRSYGAVCAKVRELGLKRAGQPIARLSHMERRERRQQIAARIREGKSRIEVAREFGVSDFVVSRAIREAIPVDIPLEACEWV